MSTHVIGVVDWNEVLHPGAHTVGWQAIVYPQNCVGAERQGEETARS